MYRHVDISVDASIFSVCSTRDAEENLNRYISSIDALEKIIGLKNVSVYRNLNAIESLLDSIGSISKLCNEPGVFYVNVQDVVSRAQNLMERIHDFEGHHNIGNIDMSEVELIPNFICIQCVAAVAILRNYCANANQDHYIMVSNALAGKVTIRAQIDKVKFGREDISTLPKPPEFLECSVPIFDDFSGLIGCLDAEDILSRAEDESKFSLAIQVAIFRGLGDNIDTRDWSDIRVPYIGVDFLQYWNRIRKNFDGLFYRDFLRAVKKISCNDESYFEVMNTDCGKEKHHVARGKIVAMKIMVDDSIYIHFWRSVEGSFELASIHSCSINFIPVPSRLILRGR